MSIDIKIPGFELIEEIGAGGMAKVYLGVQTLLERKVAIKVLHQRLSLESEEFKQRFFAEGKVLAKLQHDNIVSIIDIGEADGSLYMVMEYVKGGTLADLLKQQQLEVAQSVHICAKVGEALHATHEARIVHRDLKPSNILLRNIYTPLLTDFGIARQTDADQSLTQTGHIVGTIQYMSPEQIRGIHVDHRSDIYSLGLMFYRLLVGQLPFQATSQFDLSRMQIEEPPPPLPPHLSGYQRVMDLMLAKDPEARFRTACDFSRAVQSVPAPDVSGAAGLGDQTVVFDPSRTSYPDPGSGSTSTSGGWSQSGPTSASHSGSLLPGMPGTSSGPYPPGHGGTVVMPGTSGHHYQTGSGTPTGSGVHPQDERREKLRKILTFGIPALAVVVATILYFAIWYTPSTGLSDEQQRRVDNWLEQVGSYILVGQIEDPPGRNAIETLNNVLRIAPEYPPALEYAEEIAEHFEFSAMDLRDSGSLDAAMAEVEKGLEMAPEYEPLLALRDQVQSVLAAQQLQRDLEEALQLARSFEQQGQLTSPEGQNAYEQYQRMLELQPNNADATDGLSRILSSLVSEIRDSLGSGELDLADNRVDYAASLFPNETSVNRLRDQVNERRRAILEQQEIEQYLARAEDQMSRGQYLEPTGDNALESYREVINRQTDNERANQGLERIAGIFRDRAQQAFDRGEYSEALRLIDTGYQAVPDHAGLAAIQSEATGRLGEHERLVQNTLQAGRDLLLTGRFLPPGDNALDTFRSVLELDPGNPQATSAIARMPDQVHDGVLGMQRFGDLRGARELAQAAMAAFSSDSRFAGLNTSLETAIAQQDREDRLRELLAAASGAVSERPVTLAGIDRAAAALSAVDGEFPGNLTANGYLSDLVGAIREEALKPGGSEEGGFVLLDHALTKFAGNQRLTSARASLVDRRNQRLAAERAAREAMMGKLVVDAVPWGEITEIRGADGTLHDLPSNRSTPILLDLMAGSYTISVNNADGSSNERLSVAVAAQQTVTHIAEFGTLTAEQYFERSGWWQ